MVDYSTDKTVVKPKCKANAAQRAGLQYGKAEKEGEKHGMVKEVAEQSLY